MEIKEYEWYSENVKKEMALRVYGRGGEPYIIFPTSEGRYYDYENFGMIESIKDFINEEKIIIFTVDSYDRESWFDLSLSAYERNRKYELFEKYIIKEVFPFVYKKTGYIGEKIMLAGNSMGAYHSMNLFLKHPNLFKGIIGLSGIYNLEKEFIRFSSKDMKEVYFNSPNNYLKNLNDIYYLEEYRKNIIMLSVGEGDGEIDTLFDLKQLHNILINKKINALIEYWGVNVSHEWFWWKKQMKRFLHFLYY